MTDFDLSPQDNDAASAKMLGLALIAAFLSAFWFCAGVAFALVVIA